MNTELVDQGSHGKPVYDHSYQDQGNSAIYIIDTNDINMIKGYLPDPSDVSIVSNRITKIETLNDDNLTRINIFDKLRSELIISARNTFLRSKLINLLFKLGYDTINIIDVSCRGIAEKIMAYQNSDTMQYTCNISTTNTEDDTTHSIDV